MNKGKNDLLQICWKIGFSPQQFLWPAFLGLLSAAAEATSAFFLLATLSIAFEPSTIPSTTICRLLTFAGLSIRTNNSHLIPVLGAIAVLAALCKLLLAFRSVSRSVSLSYQFSTRLQSTLFLVLSGLDNRFFHERRNSDLTFLLQSFPDRLAVQLRPLLRNLSNFFLFLAYCLVLLSISWQLCVICFLLGIVYQKGMSRVVRNLRSRAKAADELRSSVGAQVERLMSCYNLMKLLGQTSREAKSFSTLLDQQRKESEEIAKWTELISPLFDAMSIVMILTVIYCSQIIWGGLTVGSLPNLLVFVFLLRRANSIGGTFRELQLLWVSLQGSFREILSIFEDADRYKLPSGDLIFNGDFREVEFEKIVFSYHSNRPLLREVGFRLERGSRTAIVGPSGSGKTTLVQFLLRLWTPNGGQILIDKIPIQNFTIDSVRQHIGIVCQDTSEVFSGTLGENLLYGLSDFPENELRSLLDAVGVLERFEALPNGLQTSVTDKGMNLSGGERQLISFIRTLLRRNSIIILDEITSALDPETSEKVENLLKTHQSEMTIIEVTHNLSRTALANQILLLSEGELFRFGPLETLTDEERAFVERRSLEIK